ncbi:MAG: carboxypeptidase-like regulatory domain-containing protein, partial [Mucilaginibacter sp.]
MAKTLLSFLFLLTVLTSFGQKKYTISGTIKDESTGEQLIGATIRIKELPQSGTVTNSYGFYSIYAPEGDYTLLFTYTGYEPITKQISLHQNTIINLPLPVKNDLKEVVIRADAPNNDNIAS